MYKGTINMFDDYFLVKYNRLVYGKEETPMNISINFSYYSIRMYIF